MSRYGILVVDTSWANDDSIQIDKATYHRHRDELAAGARALIYMDQPISAVVAEAEITSDIIEVEPEPPDPTFNPAIPANLNWSEDVDELRAQIEPPAPRSSQGVAHSYYVPLKLTQFKGQMPPIPLSKLQTILGKDFSLFDERWFSLSEAQYQQIVGVWDKASTS